MFHILDGLVASVKVCLPQFCGVGHELGPKTPAHLHRASGIGFDAVIVSYPYLKEKEDVLYIWRQLPVKMSPGCLAELRFFIIFSLQSTYW